MSTCICGHTQADHHGTVCTWSDCLCDEYGDAEAFAAATIPSTESESTMSESLPRVIDVADVLPGDLIELTSPVAPEWCERGRVADDGDLIITTPWGVRIVREKTGPWRVNATIRLLERRPAPPLPTTPGAAIRCTIDGKRPAVVVRSGDGYWQGAEEMGEFVTVTPKERDRITDWTVLHDPSAPVAEAKPVSIRLDLVELLDHDGPVCGDQAASALVCTREKGHDGVHVAGASRRAGTAVWGELA